jgi:hypothetical protein
MSFVLVRLPRGGKLLECSIIGRNERERHLPLAARILAGTGDGIWSAPAIYNAPPQEAQPFIEASFSPLTLLPPAGSEFPIVSRGGN